MVEAYINRIVTAVPPFEVHGVFLEFGRRMLAENRRAAVLFERMAGRSGIESRYSSLAPAADPDGDRIDCEGLYTLGRFPGTGARMQRYEAAAAPLAVEAVTRLGLDRTALAGLTHLVTSSCTGFAAPGVDLALVDRLGLDPSIERTAVGFMGCHGALNALKVARHIVRSEPNARVLMVNLELCTLHLQETASLEQVLCFLLFGDGCAASVVSADPVGIEIGRFRTFLEPGSRELITWRIGDLGFDMLLAGGVPAALSTLLERERTNLLGDSPPSSLQLWAVHPGGRSVLDAVEEVLALPPEALAPSRSVLSRYGNMSSATVMFVLADMLRDAVGGEAGCAMAFGPGVTAETMLFRIADQPRA